MNVYLMAQSGDAGSLSALLREHSPLVRSLSARFPDCREDAFQLGCMGLVKAFRRFDVSRGFRFSTHAVPMILGEMQRARDQTGGWREAKKLRALRAYLAAQGETPPSTEDASKVLNMNRAEVVLLPERLEPWEAWLLCQRFLKGRSQKELSCSLGSGASRVSRKEKNAKRHFACTWTESERL